MLGTFPKAFSQAVTSQEYFPKWQLPKCAISQVATSQVFPSRSVWPQPVLAAALGPLSPPSLGARPPLQPAAPQRV